MIPVVSVVISVKNRAALLRDCLAGLAAQSLPLEQFEVIVIDNCSTQDLSGVIHEAQEAGLHIRSDRTAADHGPAPARNLGVSLARGAIIAFTDSDCRPDPAWLTNALPAFTSPQIIFASGPILAKPGQRATPTSKMTFITHDEHPTFPTANFFVRRGSFLEQGGFNPALSFRDPLDRATECADTDLAWRLIEAGAQRRFVRDAVMYHEIEWLSYPLWVLESSRLFVLPELVRRHPQLRRVLLRWRCTFYPPALLLYPAAAFIVAALLLSPWLLLAPPILLIARGVQRTRSVRPDKLLRFAANGLFHMPRMMVMSLALLYGSIRFRSLVL